MTKQGLKDKTVRGVGWRSAVDNVASYFVSFWFL